MPHGMPDWGQVEDVAGYILTEDLAELAARLGSPCTFDRRGSIFFMDDFSKGVGKWELTGDDNGESFVSFAGYARSSGYSGRLQTGDTDGNAAQIERYFPFPKEVKLGFEISFTVNYAISEIRWGLYSEAESKYVLAEIFYDVEAEALYYINQQGTRVSFATSVVLEELDYCFHTAKLVIDLTSSKYVRFILNDTEYDLSSYQYYVGGTLIKHYIYAYLEITTGENSVAESYIDNAIITRDES